ncbi:MAG: tRNA (cytidine(34)-2'-O)-methyltransferase [Planctomycetota bacterium]|jgi:tRNA (cytidine/uridine-2'-O-)-methyltransferase|nr:tRNA (cytidine(34)-2'-O)-methyltransferase [Planctomycetota bacterium]MDP7132847.1 tRNA (cytidine(34)-2'-O)-methyltransferase [Planctomycetota bacterium]MDP7249138.1 tRNA (cytidine(34)-2'-O)-methyltransferase [Planctomycetota bacterium]
MASIVLVEPEIPQNTGNIGRLCACTDTDLHLVGALGFSIDEKAVRRAGMDYWLQLDVKRHETLEGLESEFPDRRFVYCSSRADQVYTEFAFRPDDFLVFGKETAGLPRTLISENQERSVRIPMCQAFSGRSLNLAHATSIVLYELIRQCELLK